MGESRLMIVMSDEEWTRSALHSACALSRRNGADVMLLKMVPVRHPLLLGDYAGYIDLTFDDARSLEEMATTAEDYGVPLDVHVFQYASYWPGVVSAAEQFGPTAVIARVPPSHIPFWQDFRRRRLSHQLSRRRQSLWGLRELTEAPDAAVAQTQGQGGRTLEHAQP